MQTVFKYDFSKNYISFDPQEDTLELWMDEIIIDYEYPKIFIALLKSAFDKFSNIGYKKVIQHIPKEDWELVKDLKWLKKTYTCSSIITIECNIEDALENIIKGIGINI